MRYLSKKKNEQECFAELCSFLSVKFKDELEEKIIQLRHAKKFDLALSSYVIYLTSFNYGLIV
jgi:hypothetical protein